MDQNEQNGQADDQGLTGWNRGEQQEGQQGLDQQQNQQSRQQDGGEGAGSGQGAGRAAIDDQDADGADAGDDQES